MISRHEDTLCLLFERSSSEMPPVFLCWVFLTMASVVPWSLFSLPFPIACGNFQIFFDSRYGRKTDLGFFQDQLTLLRKEKNKDI